jgi:hypothetical protein
MEQQGQQCWWESEQAQQIAGGWTAEKQRRHDERQKQAGDRESDWKLLMQQHEQDGISFTRSSTAAAATAVQATNDEQGIRGGSKPETAKAVGSSWSTKAHTKHEKKERRRQRVEAKLGAAAAEDMVTAAATAVEAETDETTKLKDPERPQRKTQEAPKMELDVSGAVDYQEPAASTHKAEQLQGQDKDQRKKEKEKRRRLKRRQKVAEAKATAAAEER